MAARKRRITLSDDWRERIKIGEIMSRLNRHVMGDCEMTQTQIAAAKVLLSKVAPDLRSVEHSGDSTVCHTVINAQPEMSIEEWQKEHQKLFGDHSPDPKPH